MTSKLTKNLKRRIKAIYYSYDLLQFCEMYYDENRGKEDIMHYGFLKQKLIKINGKDNYMFKSMTNKNNINN